MVAIPANTSPGTPVLGLIRQSKHPLPFTILRCLTAEADEKTSGRTNKLLLRTTSCGQTRASPPSLLVIRQQLELRQPSSPPLPRRRQARPGIKTSRATKFRTRRGAHVPVVGVNREYRGNKHPLWPRSGLSLSLCPSMSDPCAPFPPSACLSVCPPRRRERKVMYTRLYTETPPLVLHSSTFLIVFSVGNQKKKNSSPLRAKPKPRALLSGATARKCNFFLLRVCAISGTSSFAHPPLPHCSVLGQRALLLFCIAVRSIMQKRRRRRAAGRKNPAAHESPGK